MLQIKKLIFAVPWELFVRYFDQLTADAEPNPWAFLNPTVMEEFLADPDNEAGADILEDFYRINDVCSRGASLLFRAYEDFGIECDGDEDPFVLSMRLFLDHRRAFDYAWSLYTYQHGGGKTWQYRFPAGVVACDDAAIALLRASLQPWFHEHKEGQQCEIEWFPHRGGLLIRVARGRVIANIARWQDNAVKFERFRPAIEDVIVYEPALSRLSVRARLRRDREYYVRRVAEYVAGNGALADEALSCKMFSLEPFRDGSFDYRGDGVITRIELVEVKIHLADWLPTIILKEPAVQAALASEVAGVPLRSGDWMSVRLRFELSLESGKRAVTATVQIEPPGYSDLVEKTHAAPIEDFLRRQRVKLF